MGSFISLALSALEIYGFKVKKQDIFKPNFPFMKFQKVGTKPLIYEISKLVFKWLFCNIT